MGYEIQSHTPFFEINLLLKHIVGLPKKVAENLQYALKED
jgi:hypothetical protein